MSTDPFWSFSTLDAWSRQFWDFSARCPYPLASHRSFITSMYLFSFHFHQLVLCRMLLARAFYFVFEHFLVCLICLLHLWFSWHLVVAVRLAIFSSNFEFYAAYFEWKSSVGSNKLDDDKTRTAVAQEMLRTVLYEREPTMRKAMLRLT